MDMSTPPLTWRNFLVTILPIIVTVIQWAVTRLTEDREEPKSLTPPKK